MNGKNICGSIIVVVGICLMILGVHAVGSVWQHFGALFTGGFIEPSLWYVIGGAAWILVGALWFTYGKGHLSRHRGL